MTGGKKRTVGIKGKTSKDCWVRIARVSRFAKLREARTHSSVREEGGRRNVSLGKKNIPLRARGMRPVEMGA